MLYEKNIVKQGGEFMAEKKKVPEFAMLSEIVPWWHRGDPPSDIYKVINEEQLAKLVQLQVKYRVQMAQAQLEFYNELSKMMGR
jgi:hypothetical protein